VGHKHEVVKGSGSTGFGATTAAVRFATLACVACAALQWG
jgi:hypothetical protein